MSRRTKRSARAAAELERTLGGAMIAGPSYIGRDRARCEQEHRDTLDELTEQLRLAREDEA